MAQCKKCKLFISTDKGDVIKCKGACEGVYHKKCVNIKQFHIKNELCDSCSQAHSSPKSQSPNMNVTENPKINTETVLRDINSKLEILYEMKTEIKDLTKCVEFYAEQYQELFKFKETAEKKINALENKNIYLQKINEALEERVVLLELKESEKRVELSGMEEKAGENIKELVENVAQKLNLDPGYIEEVKRVGREKKDSSKQRPIMIALRSKTARDEWISKRKHQLCNADVFNNKNNNRIYINECLPRNMKQLLWNAKTLLKEKYKFIWVQNLRILVRKTEDSNIINIRSESDVNKLNAAAANE